MDSSRRPLQPVSDAADYAPNTFFHEFTARKLSNPRFRGVGSSPNNPGVTTYIDGVPQLNANSSSIELMDVDQIEFVRGPQSALFGRNVLGGLVNVTSARRSNIERRRTPNNERLGSACARCGLRQRLSRQKRVAIRGVVHERRHDHGVLHHV